MSLKKSLHWQLLSAATQKEAEKDARIGHHDPQAVVTSLLGPQPPTADERISTRENQAALSLDLEDASAQEDEAYDRAVEHPRPIYLRLGIAGIVLAEFTALIMLLHRQFGWAPFEANILGAGLTVGSIFCARLAFSSSALRMKIAGIALFIAISLSFATLRHEEARQKIGGGSMNQAAATVIMTLVSILPPIFAEHLLQKLPESILAWRIAGRLGRRRKRDGKANNRAKTIHDRRADEHDDWQEMADRITAVYDRAYRHARARLGKGELEENDGGIHA